MHRLPIGERSALAALLAVTVACSRDAQGTGASSSDPPRAAASAGTTAAGGKVSEAGPGGARQRQSIALSASDIQTVEVGSIEDATPITGDLRPIESAEVRARTEGDIDGVYAREGQRVTQGQSLARFESSQQFGALKSAEADRASAQTDLSSAQWNQEQSQELFKAGAIPERDLRVTQSALEAARARVAAADAKVRAARREIENTRITAPTSGTVSKRSAENGEHVARGTLLFTVVRNSTLELAASVAARKAGAVAPGQVVHFSVDGRSFDGRVARVSPTIDPATRSVTVYVQVPNPGNTIRGGSFATGRIVGRTISGALIVPSAAVHQSQDSGKPFVYRIDGTTIALAPVELGIADEEQGIVEVKSGLRRGDRILTGNVGTVGKGMQVEILGETRARSAAQ